MEFDLQWLLLAFPVTFLMGWLASRMDLKQVRREKAASPQAYHRGLNLLLNEQQDKAIDAFIEAVQHDPDTSDLHFALGSLFRRRGEYERAIRVHQHLLSRADLKNMDRDRARYGLAQDFLKAGLLDRAEESLKLLDGTAYNNDAQLALLSLHEHSRNWQAAIEVAQWLEKAGMGSFANRISHHWCELALQADAKGLSEEVEHAIKQAKKTSPQAARPLVIEGQRQFRAGLFEAAMHTWEPLITMSPHFFVLIASEYSQAARQCGKVAQALERMQGLYSQIKAVEVLQAMNQLQSDPQIRRHRWIDQLQQQPSLTAAQGLISERLTTAIPLDHHEIESLQLALAIASRPLQRYRCAACGFEGQHYSWQCLGCQTWDSFPPKRLEAH